MTTGARLRDARHHRHHPWRVFAGRRDWRLVWTDDLPPGRWGLTVHSVKLVLMANGLDQAERRCTIVHETQHILRGPVAPAQLLREELNVDRRVGRLLVPSVRRIGHAMAWHQADAEKAADELWIDKHILDVRLSSLTSRGAGAPQRAAGDGPRLGRPASERQDGGDALDGVELRGSVDAPPPKRKVAGLTRACDTPPARTDTLRDAVRSSPSNGPLQERTRAAGAPALRPGLVTLSEGASLGRCRARALP